MTFSAFSQQIDTVYTLDGKIDGYGQIKDGKRVDTWCFLNYGEKCYKTITYLDDNKGFVKYFDDKDFYEHIYINLRGRTNKKFINNLYYLQIYADVLIKPDYSMIGEGEYISYYPNGELHSKGFNKNNLREGVWSIWYYSGKLGNKLNYKQNKLDGLFITYYENGQIMFIGNYKEDAQIGLWKEYYEKGNLKSEGNYCEDIAPVFLNYDNIDSLIIEYPNLIDDKIFLNYTLDFKSGKWCYYNEEGKIIREEFYQKGKLKETIDF